MMAARKSAARLVLASILIMSLVYLCPAQAGASATETADTPAFKLLRMAIYGSFGGSGDSLDLQIHAALLPLLAEITPEEITAFASAEGHNGEEILYAYNLALARALAAAIRIGAISAEEHPETLPILALFLEGGGEANRAALRQAMTEETLAALSAEYGLPDGFVRFMILDTRWNTGNAGTAAGPDTAGTPSGNGDEGGNGTTDSNAGPDGSGTPGGNNGTDGGGQNDDGGGSRKGPGPRK